MKNNFNLQEGLKGKNLLIISHDYTSFIKDETEIISSNFKHVDALVRYNLIKEISYLLPVNHLKHRRKKSLLDLTNKPEKINVIPTPVLYLLPDSGYKKLGEKHFKAAERAIKNNNIKFDLIHSHFTWSAGYAGAKLKGKYGVPFIVTAHGYDIYDLPFRDEEWREKIEYVLNSADYIITVSNSNLECIKKLNVKTPVKIRQNGFKSDLFYPRDLRECREILGLPLNKKLILTVGNLEEVKGHKYLIEAMPEVVKYKKDVLCIIVGSGKLKNKLENRIKKLELGNYVSFVGGKPHQEIPLWMNACDIFVLPSLRESFGIVQIEAMACGKPVVATFNGGSEEVIINEKLGILVEPKTINELANAILKALDKEWVKDYILNYAKQYSWDKIVKNIIGVYNELLEKK